MRTGGIRRVYVPGNLSFPKGLASSPGKPRIPPATPLVFDVELVYCPGLPAALCLVGRWHRQAVPNKQLTCWCAAHAPSLCRSG